MSNFNSNDRKRMMRSITATAATLLDERARNKRDAPSATIIGGGILFAHLIPAAAAAFTRPPPHLSPSRATAIIDPPNNLSLLCGTQSAAINSAPLEINNEAINNASFHICARRIIIQFRQS
jgi:hypothetical protein